MEKLWRACSRDLYRQQYEGLYCTGCEQFYTPPELCAEHETPLERVLPRPDPVFRRLR